MKYTESGARISGCGRYRYKLWREWRGSHDPKNWRWAGFNDGAGEPMGEPKACLFIMLNPSTADGETDDATIRRCVGFARSWNYERLEVVNLFAFRATKPKDLFAVTPADDPVGWENSEIVKNAAIEAGLIVAAWGAHGGYLGQNETMLGWLGDLPVMTLGLTASGHPRHPLYVPSSAAVSRINPERKGG